MKILVTADLHLGGLPAIGKMTEHGVREREWDAFKALYYIFDLCKQHKVDNLVIAGDIFDKPNPDSTIRKLWAEALMSLDGTQYPNYIDLIVGNHDIPNNDVKENALKVDDLYLQYNGRITLYDFISPWIISPDIIAIYIPYMKDKDDLKRQVLQIFKDEEGANFYIFGHIEIEEATFGPYDTKLNTGFSISDELFNNEDIIYAGLGHIHKPQIFNLSRSRRYVEYVGSPISKDYNEADDARRVTLIDTESTDQLFREIIIPDRDFITIVNGKGFDELTPEVVQGNFVRLRFSGTKDYVQSFNIPDMVRKVEGMGTFHVKYDVTISKESVTTRAKEFSGIISVPRAIERYVELYGADLNKERILAKASERVIKEI
jgi:DNA repair protein SbcD/Mre11